MKRIKKHLCLLKMVLVLLIPGPLMAQISTVTGTVTESGTGVAMPGVSIMIQGTTIGTITDVNGKYSIDVTGPDATLVFSFVGYLTETFELKGTTELNVQLVQDILSLDEVVVVGYGTVRKNDLTGAVSVVNTEDLQRSSRGNLAQALQGQVSGVQVQTPGAPGAQANVRVRGVGTFGTAEPLYVVDGVPMPNFVRVNAGEFPGSDDRTGGISDINPSDIESIQVLKDASAAAIYGSRGANGVVIITTKRGKAGEISVNYQGSYGWESLPKSRWYKMANRVQFQEVNNIARENGNDFSAPANDPESPRFIDSIDTDWQDAVLETGYITDHVLSFQGGNENSKYYASLGYFDQSGIMAGTPPAFKRYSIRVNGDQSRGRFNFGQSILFTHTEQDRLSNTQWASSIHSMLLGIPTVPVYDTNNLGGFGAGDNALHAQIVDNQVALNHLRTINTKRYRILASAYADVMIIKGLNYRLNLSYDHNSWFNYQFVPEFELGRQSNPIAFMDQWRGENPYMLMEHTLTFNRSFNRHNLTLLAGYTAQKDFLEDIYGHAEGFQEPYLRVLNAGPDNRETLSSRFEHALISYLSRLNYSFDDRYFVTVNFRSDASSRFGPENKWGHFPSFAGAWKISNESFFDVPVINLLKLRGGWGKIGNENIGDYLYESFINAFATYPFGSGLPRAGIQTVVSDPGIKWEERTTSSIAFDAALFRSRLEFSAEYYHNVAEDILYDIPIPLTVGSQEFPTINAASMVNRGIEISAAYRKAEGQLHYSINGNLTTLKNKVTKIGNDLVVTNAISRTEKGTEMGELYGYVFDGIFQTAEEILESPTQEPGTRPGDVKFKNLDGNDVINEDDQEYLGSAFPRLTGGLNFTLEYRNFDFSIFFQGVYGNKIVNWIYQSTSALGYGNYSVESYENYWRGENTSTTWPRPTTTDPNGNNKMSDRWIQDGSYLRIQNIQIGYTLPERWFNLVPVFSGFRVYAAVQNLFTLTGYKGYDPDVTNDGLFLRGEDYGSYPTPRTIKIGVNMSL